MRAEFINIAWKNMKKRKLRSFLTLIGIVISIATIFMLVSISLGLEKAVEEQFRLLGTDKFFIQPRGQIAGPGTASAATLTSEDVKTIEKVSGVKELSAWTATSAQIEFEDEIRFVSVVGIDLKASDLFIETGAYKAEEGRLLKEGDTKDIMIGAQYKHNNFFRKPVKTGDTILINEMPFEVQGILKPIGNPGDDRLIYMPQDGFRELFKIPEKIDTIVVQVEEQDKLKEVASSVERKLIKSRGLDEETKDFFILTPEEVLESFGTILTIVTSFLLGVATISLFVGGIGIANTMFASVLERTREIGIMKAVGAKNKDILSIFLIESGLLGLIGGTIGVILGAALSKTIEYVAITQIGTTLLQASISAYLVIGCLLFAFLSGAISGIWPAWQATRVKPVEALRYE
ncbi:ABC transporter permease [Candidatus Pacearchaeota archaeon]|nr:ABC transporter permease [Candidatus Pacearchaeota archaeon]